MIVKANEIAGTLEVAWTMPDGVSAEHSVIIERAYRRVERPEIMALLDVTLYAERIAIELARVEEVVFARIDVDTEFTCAQPMERIHLELKFDSEEKAARVESALAEEFEKL